jgi:hypothetical protein
MYSNGRVMRPHNGGYDSEDVYCFVTQAKGYVVAEYEDPGTFLFEIYGEPLTCSTITRRDKPRHGKPSDCRSPITHPKHHCATCQCNSSPDVVAAIAAGFPVKHLEPVWREQERVCFDRLRVPRPSHVFTHPVSLSILDEDEDADTDTSEQVADVSPDFEDSYRNRPSAEPVETTIRRFRRRFTADQWRATVLRAAGRKQGEIAEELGVTDRTVRRILTGADGLQVVEMSGFKNLLDRLKKSSPSEINELCRLAKPDAA